jgi:hypothetical protein
VTVSTKLHEGVSVAVGHYVAVARAAVQVARCRELRALRSSISGLVHPLAVALAKAIADPVVADWALALSRRKSPSSKFVLTGDRTLSTASGSRTDR